MTRPAHHDRKRNIAPTTGFIHTVRRLLIVIAGIALVLVGNAALAAGASAAPSVSVYPTPGSRSFLPGTQIGFRGIPASKIGNVSVVGSRTGAHQGRIAADSDGNGGSFIPTTPFAAGETVSVSTGLNVIGGKNGSWKFQVVTPAGSIAGRAPAHVPAGRNGVMHFNSRPDLQPAALTVTKNSASSSLGDIFVAPQYGPAQDGPMLLDPTGHLIWFHPTPSNQLATDFRVQQLGGKPVLTWWQGSMNNGSGRGNDYIYNTDYQQIAVVRAGNGLQGADLHEFDLTNGGNAWIIAVSPIRYPGTSKPLMDSVVQEIDIKTGLVMFEWHAFDHVPLSTSFFRTPHAPGHVWDPYHANSVSIDSDGNPIVSVRNTWAAYKIDRSTGNVIWTLGSSRSSFKMGSGTRTAFQHDLVVQPDGTLTIFDDGAGPPRKESQSRAIRIAINTKTKTASLVKQYFHSPALSSNYEGGAQMLPGGDLFVDWGQKPYFSEFNSKGQMNFDAHWNTFTPSYRAYRMPWNAQPPTLPTTALSRGSDGISTIYASWNGATTVSSWNLLGGNSPGGLKSVGSIGRHGFETAIRAHSMLPYFAVQALGSNHQVLATSQPTGSTKTRMSIFGHSAFVSAGGTGGLFVGCFSGSNCSATATISAGRTVIARTGKQTVPANSGGPVFFSLSGTGRSMLRRARGHQLGVSVSVRNADRASTSRTTNLIPYKTSGPAPHTSTGSSPSFQILSKTAFVSSKGVGGMFLSCKSSAGCHVSTTITAGRTEIAKTGSEYIGGGDCGLIFFTLSSAGQSALSHARGNQLGAVMSSTSGRDRATASINVVRWG
jgi:hypothetical protein